MIMETSVVVRKICRVEHTNLVTGYAMSRRSKDGHTTIEREMRNEEMTLPNAKADVFAWWPTLKRYQNTCDTWRAIRPSGRKEWT